VMQPVASQLTSNPDVTAILSSLLAGSGQPMYQAPPAVQPTPDLASLLQSLSGGQALPPALPPVPQQGGIPANIDLSALLSHLQPQIPQPQPQQRWASPPRREERHHDPEPERRGSKIKRDTGSRIKASRLDDIRDSVRNSNADQNVYRALCQFYVCFPVIVLLTWTEDRRL
jgi:hypothetical protein